MRGARREIFFGVVCALAAWSARAFAGDLDDLETEYRDAIISNDFWKAADAASRAAALPGVAAAQRTIMLRRAARARGVLGDWAQAEKHLRQALSLSPEDDQTLLALARLARERPEEALALAERAAAGAPAGWRRARALDLAGRIRLALGDFGRARPTLERALADDPDDLDALRALALGGRALTAADRAPSWRRAAAYRTCARIYAEAGDARSAAMSLRRAIAVKPWDLAAWEDLARVAREAPEAIKASAGGPDPASAAQAKASDELESLRREIEAAMAAGRSDEAAERTLRLVEAALDAPDWQRLDAQLLVSRLWRGQAARRSACSSLGRVWELDYASLDAAKLTAEYLGSGLAECRSGADIGSHILEGYARLIEIQRGLRDAAAAEASRTEALADFDLLAKDFAAMSSDERSILWRHRAQFHRGLQEYPAALKAIEQALASVPDEPNSLQDAFQLALEAGKPRDALAYAEQIVKAREKGSAAERVAGFRQLALVQRKLGDRKAAKAAIARALALVPDDPAALQDAAQLAADAGLPRGSE